MGIISELVKLVENKDDFNAYLYLMRYNRGFSELNKYGRSYTIEYFNPELLEKELNENKIFNCLNNSLLELIYTLKKELEYMYEEKIFPVFARENLSDRYEFIFNQEDINYIIFFCVRYLYQNEEYLEKFHDNILCKDFAQILIKDTLKHYKVKPLTIVETITVKKNFFYESDEEATDFDWLIEMGEEFCNQREFKIEEEKLADFTREVKL